MIFINPSHGGYDLGGASNVFLKEKDVVLKISKYQKKRFDELGIENLLLRDDDYFLSLNDRLTIINNKVCENDLLISNHLNYGADQGMEIIYSYKTDNLLVNFLCNTLKENNILVRNVYQKLDRTGSDFYDILKYPLCKNKILIYYGFCDNDLDLENIIYNWPSIAEEIVKAITEYLGITYQEPKQIIYIAKEIESIDDLVSSYKISKEILKKENQLKTDIIYPNTEIIINLNEKNN